MEEKSIISMTYVIVELKFGALGRHPVSE